jgi:hypothetical protein
MPRGSRARGLEGTCPVGIVALGDIAVENEPGSVLSVISAAAPNE